MEKPTADDRPTAGPPAPILNYQSLPPPRPAPAAKRPTPVGDPGPPPVPADAARHLLDYAGDMRPVGRDLRRRGRGLLTLMTFALYGLSLTACSGCGLAVFGAATVGRASDAQADPLATALCGIITVGFGLATGFWAKETWLGLLDDAVDVGRGTGADGRPPPAGPR